MDNLEKFARSKTASILPANCFHDLPLIRGVGNSGIPVQNSPRTTCPHPPPSSPATFTQSKALIENTDDTSLQL